MSSTIQELRAAFDAQLAAASTDAAVKALHDTFLGRKSGSVTAALKVLLRPPRAATLPISDHPPGGQRSQPSEQR
jgi:hypothetical protein